jgi:hypothetical protein
MPLYKPASGVIIQSQFAERVADITTTSVYGAGPPATGYVTLLTLTLTTEANYLRSLFTCSGDNSNASARTVYFRLLLDGVKVKGSSFRTTTNTSGTMATELSSYGLVTAGSHTVAVQWCTSASTARIRPVTNPNFDHASLLVQELQA